jgi:hypothetical protein
VRITPLSRSSPPGVAVQERARDHVEHLVGDDEAVDLVRQAIDPREALQRVEAQALLDQLALALAQVRAHLEHEVAPGKQALLLERLVDVHRELARSGTQLEHVGAGQSREHLGRLAPDALAEHRRDLGGGHEIAVLAELARARGVVAQPRRVEHQLHEARKRDPVALVLDLRGDEFR